jgi:hypothetical protein
MAALTASSVRVPGRQFGDGMYPDVRNRFFHTPMGWPAAVGRWIRIAEQDGEMRLPIPERQKTAALQDAARSGKRLGSSPVLDCASALVLFLQLTTALEITPFHSPGRTTEECMDFQMQCGFPSSLRDLDDGFWPPGFRCAPTWATHP